MRKFLSICVFNRVLELGAADTILDGQILHRLHVERDALDFLDLGLEAANDTGSISVACISWLQVDLDASTVGRRIGAVDSNERREAVNILVLENHLRQFLLTLGHRLERNTIRCF